MFSWWHTVIGWVTLQIGKRIVSRKAKKAVPAKGGGRATRVTLVLGAAAAAAAAVWLKRRSDDTIDSYELPTDSYEPPAV